MFSSNIPALFCNYIGTISIPTQKDGKIYCQLHFNILTALHLHERCLCVSPDPSPLCEGVGTTLGNLNYPHIHPL